MLTYYGYKRCSTSKKGEDFLKQHNIGYEFIDITVQPPSREVLEQIIAQSGKTLRQCFNTSGVVYREMQLKDKLKSMSESEQLSLLASDGKLMKRPMLTGQGKSTVGFKEQEYHSVWLA